MSSNSRQEISFPSDWVKRGHIYFHPEDTFEHPKIITTQDPETFVATPPTGKRMIENWGLENVDSLDFDSKESAMSALMNFMRGKTNALNLYASSGSFPSPSEQFVSVLSRRKMDKIYTPEVQRAINSILVLKVELCSAERDCWRLVHVPAWVSLAVLHNQILGPVMGWARGYHAYVFKDHTDGAVIGPKKNSWYIDMMHVAIDYFGIIDDREVPLALLLRQKGDKCTYTYDLGDNWDHTITVEDVIAMDGGASSIGTSSAIQEYNDKQRVQLVDGAGACPGEDSNGLKGMGNKSYAEFLEKYKSNPNSCREAIGEMSQCVNYRDKPFDFHPFRYNLGFFRMVLAAILDGPSVSRKSMWYQRFDETYNACYHCNDRLKPLNTCAACKRARYCSRECQAADWKKHKKECHQIRAAKRTDDSYVI
mmetsp:Transcript_15160/g.25267  ORF Transcript_15160/g.25267 Transcript_15160/m.25267 type:complete len:423 (-) Transcript_15160:287-1555(-)